MGRKILVFPTWVLIRLFGILGCYGKGHPWYNRKITLEQWAAGSTKLNDDFSLGYWIFGVVFCIILLIDILMN